jgi:hypothetical protein
MGGKIDELATLRSLKKLEDASAADPAVTHKIRRVKISIEMEFEDVTMSPINTSVELLSTEETNLTATRGCTWRMVDGQLVAAGHTLVLGKATAGEPDDTGFLTVSTDVLKVD